MLPELGEDQLRELFQTMLVMRRFEEALITLAGEFDVGHFHVYIGQEATGAPALGLLEDGDFGFTTHRNHGHLLARGVDPARMMAEILGRETGTNQGKGGTLHLSSLEHGFPVTSAATGGCIPLATGAAFGFSKLGNRRVSVCLMGDGSLEEGAWHESVNIAALEKLPIIYLCENNSLEALGQRANEYPSSSMAASPLTGLAAVFGMPAVAIDGFDAGEVHDTMNIAIARARAGDGPTFIEARTVRWPGSRPLWPQLLTGELDLTIAWDETALPDEHVEWHRSQDGILRFTRELIEAGNLTPEQALEIDAGVKAQMKEAVQFALDSPYPPPEAALDHVYA